MDLRVILLDGISCGVEPSIFMNLLFFHVPYTQTLTLFHIHFKNLAVQFFFFFSYDLPLKEAQTLLLSSSISLVGFFRRRLDLDLFCVF